MPRTLNGVKPVVALDLSQPCIYYGGKVRADGYGRHRRNGKHVYAHVAAWEAENGPLPEGMSVDHACHSADVTCPGGNCAHRACINTSHLEAVTPEENHARRKNGICRRGHEQRQHKAGKKKGAFWCYDCQRGMR